MFRSDVSFDRKVTQCSHKLEEEFLASFHGLYLDSKRICVSLSTKSTLGKKRLSVSIPYLTISMPLFQPVFVQSLDNVDVNVDEALPQVHLPQPRVALHGIRCPRRHLQAIILVLRHDQDDIPP